MSYIASIHKALARLPEIARPDHTSNTGSLLSEAYLWDEVERYAKQRSAAAWKHIEDGGLYQRDQIETQPGEHTVCESQAFTLTARVSEPVKRFNEAALAERLSKSKYHVPSSYTKEAIQASKLPTKSTVTLKITERT